MRSLILLAGVVLVGTVAGVVVADVTGPGQEDVRSAAFSLVPDAADVVAETVGNPSSLSPIRHFDVRVAFIEDDPASVAMLAAAGGWSEQGAVYRRGGIEATVTGPARRNEGPTMAVFTERSADTMAGRLLAGAAIGAALGLAVALAIRRRRPG